MSKGAKNGGLIAYKKLSYEKEVFMSSVADCCGQLEGLEALKNGSFNMENGMRR